MILSAAMTAKERLFPVEGSGSDSEDFSDSKRFK